jgi:autotransporter-associated beta strand protein
MRKISLCRLLLVAASSAIVTSQTASAADYWWDSNGTTAGFGNATGEWGVSDFWSSSSDGTAITAPVTTNSTDTVNFGTATLNYANAAVAVASAGVTVNSIVYGSGQTTAINLGTSGNVITLDGTTPTITVNHASVVQTISSPITGSSGVRKAGAGILTLGSANTYTGVTSVTAGTLNASTFANAGLTSSFGSFATPGATGITLNAATLNYSGGNITTDRGITFSGGANTTLSVANASTTLNLGDSVHSLSANAIVFNTPASSNIVISKLTSTVANMNFTTGTDANATINNMEAPGTFNIAVRTGTKAVNVGNITATSATTGNHWISGLNITGSVSVGAGATIFLGAGTPNGVTLTGSSNFNATVNIQQGGIYSFSSIKDWHATAPASSSLGAPTTEARGTIGFGNGTNIATLRYIGAGDTTNRVIHLRGSTGTVTLEQAGASGLLKFTAPMTAAAGAKIFELSGSTAGTGEIGGAIVNGSGTTSLRKIGTGTWTISSTNNSYTGTTTINAGTLALGDNDVIPNASNLSIGAATLNAATFTDTAGTLAITGAATMNLGSGAALVFADSNAVAWPGTLNIVGNFTSTSIRFGTTANGLTQAQIGKITVNDVGLGDYELDPSGFLITKSGQPDMTGPTPSPMTWTSAPAATSNSSITMTATTATDGSGVEYFFDETSGNPGGTDSGWQNSST